MVTWLDKPSEGIVEKSRKVHDDDVHDLESHREAGQDFVAWKTELGPFVLMGHPRTFHDEADEVCVLC